jgi:hypothetical protein
MATGTEGDRERQIERNKQKKRNREKTQSERRPMGDERVAKPTMGGCGWVCGSA